MDARLYLQRISYSGKLTPTLGTLTQLQTNHLLTVPFENLYIHDKIKIDLADSYIKIVIQNRGGFCYELNGLFYRLLLQLGYTVKMISARVFNKESGFGPEFDHMAIIATIDNADWLVDVGFGEFAFHPLKIEPGHESQDPRGLFRVDVHDENYLQVSKKNKEEEFIPEYIFTKTGRQLREFYEMCLYHQTSPESHFTQKRICSLPTNEGRITLTGNTLKITSGANVTERELADETEVEQVLKEYYKINITAHSGIC